MSLLNDIKVVDTIHIFPSDNEDKNINEKFTGEIINDNEYETYIILFKRNQLHSTALKQGKDHPFLSTDHKLNIEHIFNSSLHGFTTKVSKTIANDLAAHPDIEYVIKDCKISLDLPKKTDSLSDSSDSSHSNNDRYNLIWGLRNTNPLLVERKTIFNIECDTDIYILDTGVTPHNQLNLVESISVLPPANQQPVFDGHATHVAGIMGAKDIFTVNTGADDNKNNYAKNKFSGVAPGARIHSIQVLNNKGEGMLSWVVAGVDFILNRKLANDRVVANATNATNATNNHRSKSLLANLSLGFTLNASQMQVNPLDIAINRATENGIIFIVAAGNSAMDVKYSCPAHIKSVISVGAYDDENNWCDFSNFGAIDIVAPGRDIFSTWPGNQFALSSGTSMATPFITGCVALYLTRRPYAQINEVREFIKKLSMLNMSNVSAARVIKKVPAGTPNATISLPCESSYHRTFKIVANVSYTNKDTKSKTMKNVELNAKI